MGTGSLLINTGVTLKTQLGLNKFKFVKIARVHLTSQKMLFVWYDSRRPDIPITSHKIRQHPYTAMLYHGTNLLHGELKRPSMTPPVPIESYNGTLLGALIFTIDIIGKTWIPSKVFTKQAESTQNSDLSVYAIAAKNLEALQEAFTLPDYKANAESPLNKKFFKIRQKEGNTGSYLTNVIWNNNNDTVTIQFKTKPTYIGRKNNPYFKGVQKRVQVLTPTVVEKTSRYYKIYVQFVGVKEYLGTRKTFQSFSPKEQGQLILNMIEHCPAKLWENDMSFYWQGAFEDLAQVDASIYPFVGTPGKGIWNARHGSDIHLTKHFVEVLQIIKPNYQDIAKMLSGRQTTIEEKTD